MAPNPTQQLLTVLTGARSREVGGHSISLVSGLADGEPLLLVHQPAPWVGPLTLPPAPTSVLRETAEGLGALHVG